MTDSLYVATTKGHSGKSLVCLGMMELLVKKYSSAGFFRPILEKELDNMDISCEYSFAFTKEEAFKLISEGQYDSFIEKVISKYKLLSKSCNFVLVEGTSFDGNTLPFELDINADLAKNLGTPLLLVNSGNSQDLEQIVRDTNLSIGLYKKNGCTILGAIINSTTDNQGLKAVEKLRSKQADLLFDFIEKDEDIQKKSNLLDALSNALDNNTDVSISYKMFEYDLLERARASKQHVVLPEGSDDRTLYAAEILKKRDIVDLTILGDPENIKKRCNNLGIDLSGIPIIDPPSSSKLDEYTQKLYELRKHKGLSEADAKKLVTDVSYYGTMMLYTDEADGMVSGACHSTGETVRPALQIIKTSKGCSVVSSVFFMCLPGRIVLYGDCAINPSPTGDELAEIAISSAETAIAFGITPKVALLSYSSGTSGQGPDVDKVAKATLRAKELRPDLMIEGPIQYDAAVNMEVAKKKMPDSLVAGNANVVVFPDLEAGNISYKAVQREAGVEAVGPMLQGLNKPMNDLSRGCSVLDIVNTVLLTSIQAQGIKEHNSNK